MNTRLLIIAALVLTAIVGFFSYSKIVTHETGSRSALQPVTEGAKAAFQEGVHYRQVEGAKLDLTTAVQVQEFFWYGCHHCEAFEPAIQQYKQTLPSGVELVQIPVTWNKLATLHGAFFYLARGQNAPAEFHAALFKKVMSLRKEGNPDSHIQQVKEVFESFGLDTENFKGQLESPEMKSKLQAAAELMDSMSITGTPTVAVDNKWVVINSEAVSNAGFFNVVNYLVAKAQAARQ